jgi:hypothetical protein
METSQGTVASEAASTTQESTTPVESTVSASPQPAAQESAPQQASQQSGSQAAVVVKPEQPSYQPDYKFTASDKEHEIPEMYRALIKDKETEKQIKDVFSKAYGLDGYKQKHHGLRDEYGQYKQQVAPVMKIAQELDYYYKKGDLGSYFKTLGFDDKQIMQYALEKAQQLELSPEQKRVYDEREAANRQQYMLETQFRQTQERLDSMMIQQRDVELKTVLSKPEVQSFAQAFDRRNGPNAFYNECIQWGQAKFAITGQDLSADQVALEIIKKFDSPMPQPMQAMPQTNQLRSPAEVPVIPNTGSGSTSPAARAFKSLDELKKYKADKYG